MKRSNYYYWVQIILLTFKQERIKRFWQFWGSFVCMYKGHRYAFEWLTCKRCGITLEQLENEN